MEDRMTEFNKANRKSESNFKNIYSLKQGK